MKINKLLKLKAARAIAFMLTAAATANMKMIAYANSWNGDVTVNPGAADTNPFDTMSKAIGIVLTLVQFLGIGCAIFGVVQVAQSLNEDQPDKRVKGFAFLGSGVILFGLKFVLAQMGLINVA